jgi:hypothetical protein
MDINIFPEALRIFRRARYYQKRPLPKYQGTPEQVCRKIIDRCWNGIYFQTSAGHFSGFYIRDFGICAESLCSLGYRDKVQKTLQYALNRYSSYYRLTTTITPSHRLVDIFRYSPDSLAFLLHALRVSGSDELVEIYRPYLDHEVNRFVQKALQMETGFIRPKNFSSFKDHSPRKSCCYDHCMAGMISRELDALGLSNPLRQFDYKKIIKLNFWTGKFFAETRDQDHLTSDSNIFPFWCRIFDDKGLFKKSMHAIQEEELDLPYPVRYSNERFRAFFPMNLILGDYEQKTAWIHMGLCLMDVAARYDPDQARKYIGIHTGLIKKHRNFLECYDPNRRPYRRWNYVCDDSMIWASKYLWLRKQLE